ncbi:MAG: HGxxPAAW family protein [Ornithinibacter sp.]
MSEHDDHGHSVAAWTTVGILIVASAIMSLAVLFPNLWLFIGGAAVGVVGLIAGKVLSMAGYGAAQRDTKLDPSIH